MESVALQAAAWVALSASATWIWIRMAPRLRAMDAPGARRLHALPTPRGGGIAIVLTVLIAAWLGGWADAALLIGVGGLAVLGLIDDVRGLGARWKLLGQMLVIGIASWSMGVPALTASLFFLIALWSVNVWNFMDGSNGLVASQALLVAAATIGISGAMAADATSALAFAMSCALLGFLPFNTYRARVFLGDCGSYALGFLVALLCWKGWRSEDGNRWMPLAAGSAVWVDTALTLLVRALRGRDLMRAHRSHLYQWLIRTGMSHVAVMWLYLLWGIMAAAVVARWEAGGLCVVLLLASIAFFLTRSVILESR